MTNFHIKVDTYHWSFPLNNSGEINGIDGPGFDHFKGSPISSLAKEICQNSLDACLDKTKPVNLVFNLMSIKNGQIPQIEELKANLLKAEQSGELYEHNKKVRTFFSKAVSIAEGSDGNDIKCLRISDFNTTGLTGSSKDFGSPWIYITKSSGVSDKVSTAGGSKGIGKFAAYVCSDLRTVIYSTLDCEGVEAAQGISRLVSFKNEDGQITQGTGYYGIAEGNKPYKNQFFFNESDKRKKEEYGTDIYILAFNGKSESWMEDLILSVIESFMFAIYKGSLVVKVQDKLINKDNLLSLIEEYKEKLESRGCAYDYYQILTESEEDCHTYRQNIAGLGNVSLRILLKPNMKRCVAMVRSNGMKIYDQKGFNSIISFAGILYVEGEELNSYLRSLENATHTAWEEARADNVKEAKKITKAIRGFIRETFNKLKMSRNDDKVDAKIGEYLADESSIGKENSQQEEIMDKIKSFSIEKKNIERTKNKSDIPPKKKKSQTATEDDENEQNESSGIDFTGGKDTDGHATEKNDINEGQQKEHIPVKRPKKIVKVEPVKLRWICVNRNENVYRLILLSPVSLDNAYINIFLSAESGRYDAYIKQVNNLEGGTIPFEGKKIMPMILRT